MATLTIEITWPDGSTVTVTPEQLPAEQPAAPVEPIPTPPAPPLGDPGIAADPSPASTESPFVPDPGAVALLDTVSGGPAATAPTPEAEPAPQPASVPQPAAAPAASQPFGIGGSDPAPTWAQEPGSAEAAAAAAAALSGGPAPTWAKPDQPQ